MRKRWWFAAQCDGGDDCWVDTSALVGVRRLRGEVILISSGSKPNRPKEIAFDDLHTFDSDTFLQMDRIPKAWRHWRGSHRV